MGIQASSHCKVGGEPLCSNYFSKPFPYQWIVKACFLLEVRCAIEAEETMSMRRVFSEYFRSNVWQTFCSDHCTTTVGTNTYLISPPDSQNCLDYLLLDTGQGSAFPSWRTSLGKVLSSESARLGKQVRITQCVLSHWHPDHVGGVGELKRCALMLMCPEETKAEMR